MADVIAFPRLNDLAVTPTFLIRNRFYLQLSVHCPKNEQKNQCRKLKNFHNFCPRNVESCHLAAARRVKLWSLNANLFFKEPHQLTKFASWFHLNHIWQRTFHFKDVIAIFLDLQPLWPYSVTRPDFSDLGCSSCYLQNEVGDPPFFYISDITNSLSFNGKVLGKKNQC